MDIEVATGAETETPAEVAAPEKGEAPETEVTAPAEGEATAAPVPLTLEEMFADNELMQSAYELRATELREEGRRTAQSELQPRVDGINKTSQAWQQTGQVIANGLEAMTGQLGKLVENGEIDAPTLQKVLLSHPQVWQALTDTTGRSGFFHAMRGVAAAEGNSLGGDAGAKFTGEFMQRWYDAEAGAEDSADVYRTMMKARDEAMLEKATAPLRRRVKALEAANEGKDLEARKGKGPSTATGKAALGGQYGTKNEVYIARGKGEISSNEATKLLNQMITAERER